MKNATSTPFPSLELNMNQLSPCPKNRNEEKTSTIRSNNVGNSDNHGQESIESTLQNLKNIVDEGKDASNDDVVYQSCEHSSFVNNGRVDVSVAMIGRQQLTTNGGGFDSGRGVTGHIVSRDVEIHHTPIESEFDIIMAEAAQLIGEAESHLEEMRIIQVKNAILMDSLVMIGG